MRGMTVQEIMRLIDTKTRFTLRGNIVSTAGEISQMGKIPDIDDAPIYAIYEDLTGRVVVGIAQDDASPVPFDEWMGDQLAHPVLRSIDCVDVFGNVIRDLTEGHE